MFGGLDWFGFGFRGEWLFLGLGVEGSNNFFVVCFGAWQFSVEANVTI
jgi:hypothetical protein